MAYSPTKLAWRNLSHNRTRTLVGMAGVGFATILLFMQFGFRGAILKTATQVYDALEFDLLVRSSAYLHLTEPRSFSSERLWQAAALEGVASARPLCIGLSEWRAPGGEAVLTRVDFSDSTAVVTGGEARSIITIGVDPSDVPLSEEKMLQAARRLGGAGFVLIDTKCKPEYGPAYPPRFSEADIGVETTLGPRRVRIVGLFTMGAGMACNGACLTSLDGYYAACPWQPRREINLGLVSLEPGTTVGAARVGLQSLFADGRDACLEVLTRAEVTDREKRRWMDETPFGKIFGLGVIVAILVGVAIVYQVLSSDIANLIAEYATLRALGYSGGFLAGVVLRQSVLLALVGYVPSLLISLGLYAAIGSAAGIPMVMTPTIALSVLLLTMTMCVVSGIAALRKLFKADPADLF